MKRALIVLLSLTLLFLPGCGRKIQPDKYVNYVCYDHLLTAIDLKEKLERAVIERGAYKYNVAYRLLPDISDDQMVHMSVAYLLTPITYYIMQNPDNYVNVWTDWTIKKIDLYYIRMPIRMYSRQMHKAQKPDKIVSSTSDKECIEDFLKFICETEEKEESNTSKLLMTDREFLSQYLLFVRVYFNESKSVVWDSQCFSYNSESLQSRVIRLNRGYDDDNLRRAYTREREIRIEYDALYKWLSDAIESIEEPK